MSSTVRTSPAMALLLVAGGVALCVIAVLGLELALRAMHYGQEDAIRRFGERGHEILNELQSEYAWIGGRARTLPGTPLYLYKPHASLYYNVNSLGIRGPEVPSKTPGEFRVLVLGGSTVWGSRVADGQTIPAFLQEKLAARCPGLTVTVINAGVEGFGIQRETALLGRLVDRVAPDVALFWHGANDVRSAYGRLWRDVLPFKEDKETYFARRAGAGGLFAWGEDMLRRSRTAALVRETVNLVKRDGGPEPAAKRNLPSVEQRVEAFVAGYLRHMERAQDIMREKGGYAVFALQPALGDKKGRSALEEGIHAAWDADNPGYWDFSRRCAEALAKAAPRLADVRSVFDAMPGETFWDIVHVTPEGNKVAARRLAVLLEQGGLVPPCAGSAGVKENE